VAAVADSFAVLTFHFDGVVLGHRRVFMIGEYGIGKGFFCQIMALLLIFLGGL
jgi:hypothetical protein